MICKEKMFCLLAREAWLKLQVPERSMALFRERSSGSGMLLSNGSLMQSVGVQDCGCAITGRVKLCHGTSLGLLIHMGR